MTMTPMLLLRNADVYAPEAIGRHHLLIGGGKILWMGEAEPALPETLGVEIIDLEGAHLVPGLIDGHVHVSGGGGEAGFASRVPAPLLSRYTTAGVTSVIGLLGTDDVSRSTAELLSHVYALREQGMGAWAYCGGYHIPPTTLTGTVRGDIVFSDALIGVGEVAISDRRSSQPTLDDVLRLASEAYVAGLMTGKAGIVHLHMGDGERRLELVRQALDTSEIPPRVFQPTHVNRKKALFEEAVALVKRGCHVDITAFPVEDGEDAWPADEALLRYLDSGAPPERVTISSDAGGCLACFDEQGRVCGMDIGHSGALLETLNALLARGLPLERALPAFTSNVADLLRLPGKGRIKVGGDADLVALDAEGHAREVLLGGVIHVHDGAAVRRGMFER